MTFSSYYRSDPLQSQEFIVNFFICKKAGIQRRAGIRARFSLYLKKLALIWMYSFSSSGITFLFINHPSTGQTGSHVATFNAGIRIDVMHHFISVDAVHRADFHTFSRFFVLTGRSDYKGQNELPPFDDPT